MISFNSGCLELCLNELILCLDAPGENSFVSHAHFDHITNSQKILASEETRELVRVRTGKKPSEFSADGLKIELMDSGHVLGGKQLYAEWDSTNFVYTSDFKLEDSLTIKGAEVRKCENLLIEATYGRKELCFPPRNQVYEEIAEWVSREREKNPVLLGGYSLGKAQELIKILNSFLGIAPLVDKKTLEICRVYEKYGVKLDYINIESLEGQNELKSNFVAIVPVSLLKKENLIAMTRVYKKRIKTAVATGWSLLNKFSQHKQFCLSDHADYNQLMQYVKESEAKNVYTMHGYSRELASELKKIGVNAKAIEENQCQKILVEY